MTCLLERDIIIFAVLERLAQRDRVLDDPRAGIGTNSVAVRRRILEQELRMLLQRTTSIVEVMHLDVDMLRIAKRHEFLFNGVPGETISYT